MYNEERVDYTADQHSKARQMDVFYESVQGALSDGFQPIQDLAVIGPGVWSMVDVTRKTIADLTEKLGRRPTTGEIAHEFATYAQMLDRDNGWTAQLAAGSPGTPVE